MTRLKAFNVAFVALGLIAMTAPGAHACACCANENEWSQSTAKPSAFEREILNDLRLKSGVFYYEGSEQGFDANSEANPGAASLVFTGAGGEKVTFKPDGKLTQYRADIGPVTGKTVAPTEMVSLYHEWRMDGTVTATGLTGAPATSKKLKATLVLRGTGNSCVDTVSFTHWILSPRTGGLGGSGKIASGDAN